jgi:hypothetical protein
MDVRSASKDHATALDTSTVARVVKPKMTTETQTLGQPSTGTPSDDAPGVVPVPAVTAEASARLARIVTLTRPGLNPATRPYGMTFGQG